MYLIRVTVFSGREDPIVYFVKASGYEEALDKVILRREANPAVSKPDIIGTTKYKVITELSQIIE